MRHLSLRRTVRPLLDQLQVVVAELPEELFRTLQSAGVVVRLERPGGLGDQRAELGEQRQVGRFGDDTESVTAPAPRTNLLAFKIFNASRANLHFPLIKGRVQPWPDLGGTPAYGVGAVAFQHLGRHHLCCPWTCSSSCDRDPPRSR